MNSKTKERLYRIWYNMNYRCYSPKLSQRTSEHYRDKGITVCCEWKNSLDNFRQWALNNGYADGLTIDRIDSDGIYCPENCQWLTKSENSRKASAELERRRLEGHPRNGLWMVTEKFVKFQYFKYTLYGYKVLETGLYKSEAIKKIKELRSNRPWEDKYYYAPTGKYHVGDVAYSEDIRCFLR